MEDYSHIQKPDLGYRYEFATDELDAMDECLAAHGFRGNQRRAAVGDRRQAQAGGCGTARTQSGRCSRARAARGTLGSSLVRVLWELIDYEPFMAIHRHLIGTDELTIHRSAAIIRRTGSAPVGWHTDWCGYSTEIKNSGDVLNRGLWPSGKWFYLTGRGPSTAACALLRILTSRTGKGRRDLV